MEWMLFNTYQNQGGVFNNKLISKGGHFVLAVKKIPQGASFNVAGKQKDRGRTETPTLKLSYGFHFEHRNEL